MKLFGLGPLLLDRYKALSETFYEEDKKLTVRRTTWGYLLSLLGTGAFYGAYVVMALAAAAAAPRARDDGPLRTAFAETGKPSRRS